MENREQLGELTTQTFQFGEEIESCTDAGNSFTALLELPPNQAVMLLHSPEETVPDANNNNNPNNNIITSSSVFTSSIDGLLDTTNSGFQNSSPNDVSVVKQEPVDSEMMRNTSPDLSDSKSTKRKEREKNVKSSAKKNKTVANETDGEKLPYVHVRARRGQATDSHSLAERARREKINAKMKLLQELVPGCNKISGTAMVLDEIINHVQTLQRQVEFLSMRLAALHPNININLDNIFPAEIGPLMEGNYNGMVSPAMSQPIWQPDGLTSQPLWGAEDMNPNFIAPENSFLSYDSSGNSVTVVENAIRALEYLGLKENQQQGQFNGEGAKVNMIITDYSMPGMTGYELLQKIKESSMLKDVPVVIMSSENILNRISECLEKGAEKFLLKPLKLAEVKMLRCKLTKY